MLGAARYIELNAVRAGLVETAEAWRWSSARHHLGLCRDSLLDDARWPSRSELEDWRNLLAEGVPDGFADRLRKASRVGWPLGSDTWVQTLERKTGRSLRPRKGGRPKRLR